MSSEEVTVEFGPLEQRGVLLGISAPSLVAVGVGTATGLGLLFRLGGTPGLLLAVAAIGLGLLVGLLPVHGSPLAEWLLVLTGYAARAVTGRRRWRSATPRAGVRLSGRPVTADLPAPLARGGLRVVEVPFVGRRVGIILDGPHAVGVLRARAVSAFLMRQPADQAAATAHWADVIGAIGDPGSPWVRLQWTDTTTPVDAAALVRFLGEALTPAARTAGTPENHAASVYERLVRAAAPVSEAHDILLAVALDPARVARQVKDAGGTDHALGMVTVRALEALAHKLAAGDILVDGMLSARQVGQLLRAHVDPTDHTHPAADTAADVADPDEDRGADALVGVDPTAGWTLAGDEGFTAYRGDGGWHATFWVAQWPRRQSRIDFLAPLLLRTGSVTRTVSVLMAPVDHVTALRAAETAATSDESDEQLRARFGMRTSGRRRREAHAATRREEELLDGYDDVRFTAYVTVTAPSPDALDDAVADVLAQARAARLRLVRLVGQQAEAFWYTAPLCRGIR